MKTIALFILLTTMMFSECGKQAEIASNGTAAAKQADQKRADDLRPAMKAIEPFFKRMGKPSQLDWLASHTETGQTFEEYIGSNPVLPTDERKTIFVLPLGKFDRKQLQIISITADYLRAFYDLPVEMLPQRSFAEPLAAKNFRRNQYTKVRQIRTGYILDDLLQPALPKNAAALIALTNEDLYPDETMNYVFGQASLENRVGVWSLYRLDDNANYDTFLRRTLKIAAHETGHMFSMRHCTKYECVMSGTNYLGETDSRPLDACPECMAKICWLSNISPKDRYDRLATFCRKYGLTKEADEFTRKSAAVKKS